MKKRSSLIILLLLSLFLVLSIAPTFAQDVTVEPAATVVATVNGNPVEATLIAPTETPAPQSSLFSTATIGELLLFLGLSGLAGGGIVAILLSFLGKKEVRDRVEDARNSWSPEQQQVLANFTSLFERTSSGILDFLKAVQDGQPNEQVAKKDDLDFLSKQVAVHQKYYPLPAGDNPYLTPEQVDAINKAQKRRNEEDQASG